MRKNSIQALTLKTTIIHMNSRKRESGIFHIMDALQKKLIYISVFLERQWNWNVDFSFLQRITVIPAARFMRYLQL